MKRLFLLLMALSLVPLCAAAEDILSFGEDITGLYTYPEGVSEADARYVYRYCYPQIAGDSEVAQMVNNTYQYLADDALGFECPMNASSHPDSEPPMQVTVSYEVTHCSAEYLSVRVCKEIAIGDAVSRIVTGHVFPLTGPEPGALTSLPYLLGILKHDETDEWYLDRQIEKANACVRGMVWAMVEDDPAIYEDMTEEEFGYIFYPEEDFYLDAEGRFVFFMQEGTVAPEEAGVLTYTLTLEEILDEI